MVVMKLLFSDNRKRKSDYVTRLGFARGLNDCFGWLCFGWLVLFWDTCQSTISRSWKLIS